MIGKKFGRLTVIEKDTTSKRTKWICECDCGKTKSIYQCHLKSGARGITMDDLWYEDFEYFYKWSIENGYEENLELDRIDNNKGYEPSNCRWVETLTNNHNRRITVKINGLTLKEISKEYNIKYSTVKSRYYDLKKIKENVTIDDIINF